MKLKTLSVYSLLVFSFSFFSGTAQVIKIDTFAYTGSTQTFVIPSCVTTLSISLEGAAGGYGSSITPVTMPGGYGGKGTVAITPTPGVMLYINVGGGPTGRFGGFNGGGDGGKAMKSTGGGGGGASDIRIGANTLSNRFVVIGGGGGGGGMGSGNMGSPYGGDAGGLNCSTSSNTTIFNCKIPWGCGGGDGFTWSGSIPAACQGNTPTVLGAGGGGAGVTSPGGPNKTMQGCFGNAGAFGIGGNGGDSACTFGGTSLGYYGGGGGGGGWYGGAGGTAGSPHFNNSYNYNGGGGGGSSYIDSTIVLWHRLYGFGGSNSFPKSNGLVLIRYVTNGPGINITSSSASVCAGNSVTLIASGGNTYTWLPQPGFAGSTSASVIVNPGQTTQYTVQGSNNSGCATKTVVTIVVNSPSIQVSAFPGLSVCKGGTISLNASGLSSYTWSGGIQNGVPFAPTVTSVYVVTGVDQQGCSKTQSLQVIVGTQSIPITGAHNICAGKSLTLSANQGGFGSYHWNTGDSITQIVVSPSLSTTYIVSGSTPGGSCTGSGSVFIQVYQPPVIQITGTPKIKCLNDGPVTLSAGGALTFTWSDSPGTSTVTGGILVVNPAFSTQYTITGVNAAGCKSFSTYVLDVYSCVGLNDAVLKPQFQIFPNPSSGDFVVLAPQSYVVEIHTILGTRLECNIIKMNDEQWRVSGLHSGTYLVKAKDLYGKETVKRVVVN